MPIYYILTHECSIKIFIYNLEFYKIVYLEKKSDINYIYAGMRKISCHSDFRTIKKNFLLKIKYLN